MSPTQPAFSRRKTFALILGAYTALGLLLSIYRYLDFVTREHRISFMVPFLEEMSGTWTAAALFPVVLYFARRDRNPLVHVPVVIGFSIVHTTMMWVSRLALFPLFGLGYYDYGKMPVRYVMEFPNQVIFYVVGVMFIHAFDHYRASRDREVRTAQLELQNLRLQLQPHFLFNALNTISSVMYEDPRAADEMLSRLSDMLRLTLRSPEAHEVPLAQELEYLDAYLKIMQARFEDRLSVKLDLEPGTEDALVPQLILQPLVENSIRYGADPRSALVDVAVSSARSNGSLILRVRDRGCGLSDPAPKWGVGLSNTRERLSHLYGERQMLSLRNQDSGGLLVTVELPYHT